MQLKHKIDKNILILHNLLIAIKFYHYDDNIKIKIDELITYLEEFLFFKDSNINIKSEEYVYIANYEV